MRLDGLTTEQRTVVLHETGPAIVAACPGSRKKRALTHRMAYLIEERGIPPHGIMGITFTRAGAIDPVLFLRLWDEYTRRKVESRKVDFDDLLLQGRSILTDDHARRARWSESIQHLMVDEYQDTNALQWSLLELLSPPSQNLMVVGDDDQAIFGWRGAPPLQPLDDARRARLHSMGVGTGQPRGAGPPPAPPSPLGDREAVDRRPARGGA